MRRGSARRRPGVHASAAARCLPRTDPCPSFAPGNTKNQSRPAPRKKGCALGAALEYRVWALYHVAAFQFWEPAGATSNARAMSKSCADVQHLSLWRIRSAAPKVIIQMHARETFFLNFSEFVKRTCRKV